MQRLFFLTLAATALVLGTSTKAQAWGAFHAGYTHVGAGGVQHYGTTSVAGPYGSYSGSHYGSYGAGGAYHAGYGSTSYGGSAAYGGYHAYTPTYSGGYAAGGYHYGTVGGAYGAGVYRRW